MTIAYAYKVRVSAQVQRSELLNHVLSRVDFDTMSEKERQEMQHFVCQAVDLILWTAPEFLRQPHKQLRR